MALTPIHVALIGSGIFAQEEHLPAISATSLLTLKIIYSRSLSSAKSLASSQSDQTVELYSEDQEGRTFDDLLRRDDVKGVIIALPILAQTSYVQRALSAGKHVLAEKPIAKDLSTAKALIQHSLSTSTGSTLSIAENFRFLDSFVYASSQVSQLGRILGFRSRVSNFVKPGGKYFETSWRKTPEYQGGFLLDGGVHFVAGTRLLLGETAKPARVSAFTALLQEHLPPVDTLNATVQLSNGASGTLAISFGTTDTGAEYIVACEKGTVLVSRGKVVVTREGKEVVKEFPNEGSGVKQEVKAWAEGLQSGKQNPLQGPAEALSDLEVVEACLNSGEKGGEVVELKHQGV